MDEAAELESPARRLAQGDTGGNLIVGSAAWPRLHPAVQRRCIPTPTRLDST